MFIKLTYCKCNRFTSVLIKCLENFFLLKNIFFK